MNDGKREETTKEEREERKKEIEYTLAMTEIYDQKL